MTHMWQSLVVPPYPFSIDDTGKPLVCVAVIAHADAPDTASAGWFVGFGDALDGVGFALDVHNVADLDGLFGLAIDELHGTPRWLVC